MQSKSSGWLVALAIGVVASQGEQGHAQCDGPVIVQVPKQAASIAEAVAMACPGHPLEIVLAEGTWPMAIDTQDPSIEITIRGVSKTGSVVTEVASATRLNEPNGSVVLLDNVMVSGLNGFATHFRIRFSHAVVRECEATFYNPESGITVASHTLFEDCISAFYGVLYLEGASVADCIFVNCVRPIHAWGGPAFTNVVLDSSFMSCGTYAVRAYNSLSIARCVFDSTAGPAVVAEPNGPRTFSIDECIFQGNSAESLPGGAIRDSSADASQSSWSISNCTFTNNSAPSGGALYFGIDRSVTLTNCVFEGNSATAGDGGAFAHEFGGSANHLTASDCSFTGNEATERGGAIMTVGWSGTYSLNGCTFTGNHANKAGAFHNDRGLVNAENCIFNGNSAAVTGGAMTLEAGSRGLFSACEFSMNHAAEGGAIGFYFWADTTIAECMFSGNSASLRGGAVQIRLQTAPTISGCEFVGNSAPIGAAVARLDNSAGNSDFPRLMNCVFRGHDDETSDAVVSSVEWTTTVVGSSFCDNAIAAAVGDVDFDASNCVVEFCTDANGDGEVDACACPGDLNGNFFTDGADLSILLGYWGPVTNPNNPADLNDDGLVDGADLAVMLGGWGACP